MISGQSNRRKKKFKRAIIEALVEDYYALNSKYEGIDWKTKTIIYGDGGISLGNILTYIVEDL